MNFTQALEAIFKQGDRITRAAWANDRIYLSLADGRLCITGFSSPDPDDGKPHPLVVHESDYFADDWEVAE